MCDKPLHTLYTYSSWLSSDSVVPSSLIRGVKAKPKSFFSPLSLAKRKHIVMSWFIIQHLHSRNNTWTQHMIKSVLINPCPEGGLPQVCITDSLEQCLNSKRRWDPLKRSMGIGSLTISLQRGLLLWYRTKERYSLLLGSPLPKLMQSWEEKEHGRLFLLTYTVSDASN